MSNKVGKKTKTESKEQTLCKNCSRKLNENYWWVEEDGLTRNYYCGIGCAMADKIV